MVERKAYLVLAILQLAVLVGTTSIVGGHLWLAKERAEIGFFLSGALVGALHLLITLLQVDRVLRGRISLSKPVAIGTIRYWRLRIAVMGASIAIFQGLAVPNGILTQASPALMGAAAINVAMIFSGSLFAFTHLGPPKQ